MKKSSQFELDLDKATLAIYYNMPPYDKKIAAIKQKLNLKFQCSQFQNLKIGIVGV